MVMTGHAQRLAQPLRPRHKRVMALVAVLAAAAVALWAGFATSHPYHSHDGCIFVVTATATGSGEIRKCGSDARSFCATEYTQVDALAKAATPQCRLAGIARRPTPS